MQIDGIATGDQIVQRRIDNRTAFAILMHTGKRVGRLTIELAAGSLMDMSRMVGAGVLDIDIDDRAIASVEEGGRAGHARVVQLGERQLELACVRFWSDRDRWRRTR